MIHFARYGQVPLVEYSVRIMEYDLVCVISRSFLKDDPVFYVPEVIRDLSSKQVLTTELVSGVHLDKLDAHPQEIRNQVRV